MRRTGSRRARRVEVTDEIRALDTLVGPDYAAAWEVTVKDGDRRSAEQWARATFEGAPRPWRAFIVAGWTMGLGLRLGPRPSPHHVLGWRFVTPEPDEIILQEPFRSGTAHNVLRVESSKVLLATFVRHETPWGRPLWSSVAPLHHRIVPYLLGRAARQWSRTT